MALTTETEIGQAVMRVLKEEPAGEADVQTLIDRLPYHIDLTDDDRKKSETRPNEEVWEQRVRNLKSHDKTDGNVIKRGYVEHLGNGRYRLTDAGRLHLEDS